MSSNLCQQSQAHRLYSLYLHYDASHAAKHEDPECKAVLKQCFALLEKDYVVGTVANHNGQLCSSYPSELAILEKSRHAPTTDTATTIDPRPDTHSIPSNNHDLFQVNSGEESFSRHPALSSHRPTFPPTLDSHTRKLPSGSSSSSSPFISRTSNAANNNGNLLHNNTDFDHELSRPVDMDNSFLEEAGDQSFDLGESGMMSFQDIKTELDLIQTPQSQHQRHILPFPFRIPRPEKKESVAIKEYVPSPPTTDSDFSHSGKTQTPGLQLVDKDKVNDTHELSKQFEKSHFARVRARFVIPCILVRGKNICRSATLSNEVEVFMHSVNQKIIDLNQKRKMFLYGTGERSPDKEERESSLEKQRLEDIELLHQLGVTYINDLMVENRKVKYGLKVTSSEKVDSFGRYSKFKLVATPYPGVEFFQKFKANKYSARKLCFDWSQNFADAELQLPPGHADYLGIRWRDYKSWDLIELTQNYLRLYLTHIADDSSDQTIPETDRQLSKGLLIHCISGWDRTPLFISLLRISLWADGEAHESLTAAEILYLTMGYDWFLFNHLLADRSQRGEDIFYFCFYFLKFIYGEEFSLSSISRTNKTGKEVSKQTSRQATPRSPLLKDIGRVRNGVFATASPDPVDTNSAICDECQARRRPSIGRDATSIKNSHDAASSTDGKPSSWQFISFSTPPGRDRHGSPRAPFAPTLQAISRTSGSPLGANAKRGSFPSGFIEDMRVASGEHGSSDIQHSSSNASPFTLNDGRLRLGVQQFNARRSSSSSIPGLFADESERHQSPGVLASEFARVSTSPNLLSEQPRGESDGLSSESGSKGTTGENRSAPRKRASTFDGGLLLSSGQDAHLDHDDMGSKNGYEEGEEEEEEDLTSGDDDNVNDETSEPKTAEAVCCQFCHQPILSGSRPAQIHSDSTEAMFAVTRQTAPAHAEVLRHPRQSIKVNTNQPQDRVRGIEGLHADDYAGAYRDSAANECDREENMFQLEIDERPAYRRCSEGSELDCLDPSCLSNSGGYHDPMCSNSCGESDQLAGKASCIANDTESIEGDENESFWDETSTVDYGCSPASLLNGFGLGLTKCEPEAGSDNGKIGTGNSGARGIKSAQGGVDSDEDDEDDDEDDDDDGTASISSRRSSIKNDHHENDHLFAPSLEGVFSNSTRSRRRSGQSGTSIPRPMHPAQSHESGYSLADQDGSLNGTARGDTGPDVKSSSDKPRTLTRRQKLKQLRRLFMDIRGEIGDGSRPPSRALDIANNKSTVASELDDEEEIGTSLRAESFSDDSAFQYRSSISPFARHNASVSPSTTSSRLQDFGPNQSSFHRGPLVRPYGESPIVSPTAQYQHRSQHQQRSQAPPVVPSGRKSPFEWAASLGSSASEMISGGFGQSSSGSGGSRQSPSLKPSVHPQYPVHPYQLSVSPSSGSPQVHYHQQQQHAHHQHQYLSNIQSPVSGTTTPIEGFQDVGSHLSDDRSGLRGVRRHSLISSTTSSTSSSKLRGSPGGANGIKDKGGENSGRWDWMPGIFV